MNNYLSRNERIETNREFWVKIVLFIIYPFGTFLLSLINANRKSSYLIYFLFGVLFCWHMNPTSLQFTDDFYWIMLRVVENNFTGIDIWNQIVSYVTFTEDAPKEIYENVLNWFSKLFSPNPHLFFAFASVPFLVFMLGSLNKITSDRKFTQSWYCLIVLILFVLPRDIITVQNPRFGTGVWVLIFATIGFFSSKKYQWKYYFLILLTPCIHAGFWFYVIAFTCGLLLLRNQKLLMILLYVSIPFSYLSYGLLSNINFSLLPLPSTLVLWIERYLSEDSYDKFITNKNASGFFWITEMFSAIQTTTYLLVPIYLWKYKNMLANQKKLFSFYLYFYAVVNFIQFVPVLGARFYWLVRIFSIYMWFKDVYPRHNKVLLVLLLSCSWEIFIRYFYMGALAKCVPLEIFYTPLPYLIMDYWGVTNMQII